MISHCAPPHVYCHPPSHVAIQIEITSPIYRTTIAIHTKRHCGKIEHYTSPRRCDAVPGHRRSSFGPHLQFIHLFISARRTKIAPDSITSRIMNKVHKMTFIVALILSIKLMSATMHRLACGPSPSRLPFPRFSFLFRRHAGSELANCD